MWLIIAIIMLVILGSIKAYEGVGNTAHNITVKNNKKEHDAFVEKYVDRNLEKRLREFYNNEANFSVVQEEVNKALAEMPHWKPIKYHSEVYLSDLVMHIMTANRGRVSDDSANFGISTPWRGSGRDEGRYKSYELVEWIQKTLAKQGVYVTPVLIGHPNTCSNYEWKGAMGEIYSRHEKERGGYHEFSPDLLPNRPVDIPPPYYNQPKTD